MNFEGRIPVIWLHEPEEAQHYWERDWLRYLLKDLPTIHLQPAQAHSALFENALIIFGNEVASRWGRSLLDSYAESNRRHGLIHLSDECLLHDVRRYAKASVVFRTYYRAGVQADTFGLGYKRGFWDNYAGPPPSAIPSGERQYVWSFIGDVKNSERRHMIRAFRNTTPHFVHRTSGWNSPDSLSTAAYRNSLLDTLFVPSPQGVAIDCFRTYEALEAGCIPITLRESERQPFNYYERLFGAMGFKEHIPFPQVDDWKAAATLVDLMREGDEVEKLRLECHSWWGRYKEHTRMRFTDRVRLAFAL